MLRDWSLESLLCLLTDSIPQPTASLSFNKVNCSLIASTFFTTFSLLLTQFLQIIPLEQLSLSSFAPTRISKFTQAGDLARPVKSLRRKLESEIYSARKRQVLSFDFGERLTRETVFVGVRSSPSIAKHTVYRKRTLRKSMFYFNRLSKLTSRIPQEQFVFAPTLCKLNSIFYRRYKSTRNEGKLHFRPAQKFPSLSF